MTTPNVFVFICSLINAWHAPDRRGVASCQNVAMALTGNPVPPTTGTGATVNRNSHRF